MCKFLLIPLIFLSSFLYAQDLEWFRQISNVNDDIDAHSITTDAAGNVYFGGSFDDQPAPQVTFFGTTETTTHEQMGFITKLDKLGNLQWTKKFGSPNSSTGYSPLAMVEKNGFLYVAGSFEYSSAPGMDFDPDAGTNYKQSNASSGADFFLAKYNSSTGAMIWAYSGGVSNGGADLPHGIDVDDDENIYLTGFVQSGAAALTFDIKNGTAPSANGIANKKHFYLAKYTKDADFVWRINITNSDNQSGGALAVDKINGYVYFAGGLQQVGGLNPIFSGTSLTVNASSRDAFLAKYDFNGNLQWVRNIASGASNNYVRAMDVDNNGNVYVTGDYTGTADFDPSAGTRNLTAVGSLDAFVAKYNSAGNHVWSYGIGSASFGEGGFGIKVDGVNHLAIAGAMLGQADYNPEGTGGAQIKGVDGQRHIFFGEYDLDFKYVWAHAITSAVVTSWDNYASGIALDPSQTPSAVYVCGYFRNNSTQDFDPNNAGGDFTATGTQDNAFLARYSSQNLLPIKMSFFEADLTQNKTVYLTWETVAEINNDYFTIQRSANLKDWEDVLHQKGAGNSNNTLNYSDIDHTPLQGISYYRLKQTDFNGEYSYSTIRQVKLNRNESILYPNPASSNLTILLSGLKNQEVIIELSNAVGQQLISKRFLVAGKSFSENINIEFLSEGMYFVHIKAANYSETKKLIIKH